MKELIFILARSYTVDPTGTHSVCFGVRIKIDIKTPMYHVLMKAGAGEKYHRCFNMMFFFF